MTAISEQILQWIVEQFQAVEGVAEVERDASGDPTQYPSINIINEGQETVETEADRTRYAMSVKVEGYVIGGGGITAATERSELHAAVIRTMMAEPPIGGLAELIEEGPLRNATAVLSSENRLGFVQDFTIQYATRRGDPAQP